MPRLGLLRFVSKNLTDYVLQSLVDQPHKDISRKVFQELAFAASPRVMSSSGTISGRTLLQGQVP